MIKIQTTSVYDTWFDSLRDRQAQARIKARLRRLSQGNAGDGRHLGGGVSELRIDYGPGYRLYYSQRGQVLCMLLCGGDKRTQQTGAENGRPTLIAWETYHGLYYPRLGSG